MSNFLSPRTGNGLAFAARKQECRRVMRRTLTALALFAAAAACSGDERRDRPPPLVRVAAAGAHDFVDRYEAVGSAVANEQVVLSAPVTERLVRIGFADGDFVRAGQVVAVLAQGQEAAALSGAAAQAREAEQQLARIAALKEKGFATRSRLDNQVALVEAARGQAAEAQASIGDRIVRAPFSGYASLRRISAGAVVTAGTEIATISDISRIKLDFTVPETMLDTVSVGQPIDVVAAAFPQVRFGGTVSAIDPVIDPATRSATLRAVLPNSDGRLKPGMLLSVTLKSRPRRALAVPELAVLMEGERQYVFEVGKDGKAKRRPVKTGGRDGNLVEITEGLRPGQKIVTEGVVKVSDGAPVRIAGNGAGPGGQRR